MADTEVMQALNTAMARIAALESELRGKPPKQEGAQFDPRRFTLDPISQMKAQGLSDDHIAHVRTVLIADLLGDQAPTQMKMAAMQGPSMIAAQATQESITTLSRRLDDIQNAGKQAAKRDEFNKAITELKDKYPHLSKVATVEKDAYLRELDGHGGSAEEYLKAKEESLAKVAALFSTPSSSPAASVNADNSGPSTQAKPAPLASALNGVSQPPVTEKPSTAWSAEAARAARDKIVQKVSSPKV